MFGDILRGIDGIGIFPAVSLVLFVICFLAVVFRVSRMDVSRVTELSEMPLDGDSAEGTTGGGLR
jgi:hypothetical protein